MILFKFFTEYFETLYINIRGIRVLQIEYVSTTNSKELEASQNMLILACGFKEYSDTIQW